MHCTIFVLYYRKCSLELNVKDIGNLCDSSRFHSMGFLETPFIKIF